MEKTLIIIRELINEGLLTSNFGNSYVLWNRMDIIGIAGVLLGLVTFIVWLAVIDFDCSDKTRKIINGLFIAFMSLGISMLFLGMFSEIKVEIMNAEVERAMLLSNVDFGTLIKSLL